MRVEGVDGTHKDVTRVYRARRLNLLRRATRRVR
jgi:hypothetical protein